MTLDRDQIKEDAKRVIADIENIGYSPNDHITLAESCLALLTELEQPEREVTVLREERNRLEARLAKVPPLVEALRYIEDPRNHHHKPDYREPASVAREALAAWETE